jgi:sortase (surface protein transpeptidase)
VLDDGQMELPDDPARIGWYRFGPTPGEARGSVVLGGHVDSQRYGVGPLARLAAVREGARITVTTAGGSTVDYRVTSVERISKAALPTDRLFDPDIKPRLVVITCGGRYLPEAGGYEDNIVVIARPA